MPTKVDPIQAMHDAATSPDAPELSPEVAKKKPAAVPSTPPTPDKKLAQLMSKLDQQGRELAELRAELNHLNSQKFVTDFQFGRALGIFEMTLKSDVMKMVKG